MRKSEFKLFAIGLKEINNSKSFSGRSMSFKSIEDVRNAYDFLIINHFKEYDLNPDLIVDHMERTWAIVTEKYDELKSEQIKNYVDLFGLPFVNPMIPPSLKILITKGKISYNKIISLTEYITRITDIGLEIAENEIEA